VPFSGFTCEAPATAVFMGQYSPGSQLLCCPMPPQQLWRGRLLGVEGTTASCVHVSTGCFYGHSCHHLRLTAAGCIEAPCTSHMLST
jgi:hypothetical protein